MYYSIKGKIETTMEQRKFKIYAIKWITIG
jgi:hypothetical protein